MCIFSYTDVCFPSDKVHVWSFVWFNDNSHVESTYLWNSLPIVIVQRIIPKYTGINN